MCFIPPGADWLNVMDFCGQIWRYIVLLIDIVTWGEHGGLWLPKRIRQYSKLYQDEQWRSQTFAMGGGYALRRDTNVSSPPPQKKKNRLGFRPLHFANAIKRCFLYKFSEKKRKSAGPVGPRHAMGGTCPPGCTEDESDWVCLIA